MRAKWPTRRAEPFRRKVFDLPGALPTNSLPHFAAAGAGLLVLGQVVDVLQEREPLQRGDVPPAPSDSDPAGRCTRAVFPRRARRQVLLVHRPLFQGDGELQQQLPGIEPVGPRAVVPLLQPQQFHFQAKLGDLQLVNALLELTGRLLPLADGLLPLALGLLALARDHRDDRLEGGGVIGQRADVNCIIHDDDRIYVLSTAALPILNLYVADSAWFA